MKLKAVKVTKFDSCWSYAQQRVGWVNSHFPYISTVLKSNYIESFDIEEISVGDIVIWTHAKKELSVANEITSEGLIISNTETEGYHCGVIESTNPLLISDCTRKVLSFSIPTIRIRRFGDVERPAFIIKTSTFGNDRKTTRRA